MLGWKLWLVCAGLAFAFPTAAKQPGGSPQARPFADANFEASGVAVVPGRTAVLMVADSRPGHVIWMQLTPDGRQEGSIRALPIGIEVDDPEGITTDGTWFYVVGSQTKGVEGPGLVRFRFDADQARVSSVEAVEGLAAFLKQEVPELSEASEVNIEGLAWDPDRNRLLLGLRSPLLGSEAVIVPLKPKDARAPLARGNLVTDGGVIRLPLGGRAIRGFEYDRRTARFLVIAGASADDRQDFRLFEWTGASGEGLRELATFDRNLKPEGVARVGDLILVVCDTSRFVVFR